MSRARMLLLIFMSGMLVSALQFSSCGSKSEKPEMNYAAENNKTTDVQKKEAITEEQMDLSPATGSKDYNEADRTTVNAANSTVPNENAGQTAEKIPAKIIKTADISYQVESFKSSRKAILAIVSRYKGLVSSENQTNDGYNLTNTMTIRVEAPQFDSLVEDLMSEAIYVQHRTINAEDITEEFVDLSARMKSKKEVEAQYSEILKKAHSINEILEVTQYLRAIREEIESVEGRLKYINDRVAYSTITLTYYEQLDKVSQQPERTFGSRIGEAFSWGWNGLVDFFLGIIYLWPLWLITGLITWLVLFLVKRGMRRRASRKAKLNNPA